MGHALSVTVRWMLPALSDLVQRTSFGASDISVTVQVRVVAWPDITFLSVPVIAGRGSFLIIYMLVADIIIHTLHTVYYKYTVIV